MTRRTKLDTSESPRRTQGGLACEHFARRLQGSSDRRTWGWGRRWCYARDTLNRCRWRWFRWRSWSCSTGSLAMAKTTTTPNTRRKWTPRCSPRFRRPQGLQAEGSPRSHSSGCSCKDQGHRAWRSHRGEHKWSCHRRALGQHSEG